MESLILSCYKWFYVEWGHSLWYIHVHVWLRSGNTHNTIQQHILLKCVVVGTRNNTYNTIQQHILLKCVVVGTRNNTHNTIQQHSCCGYSKQHPQHHTPTHFVKMCCCGYSKQHPQHHTTHFVNVVVVCHLWTIVLYHWPWHTLRRVSTKITLSKVAENVQWDGQQSCYVVRCRHIVIRKRWCAGLIPWNRTTTNKY